MRSLAERRDHPISPAAAGTKADLWAAHDPIFEWLFHSRTMLGSAIATVNKKPRMVRGG
jgi:hypothetical protein